MAWRLKPPMCLRDLVLPRACAGCGAGLGPEDGPLCWDCLTGLPRLEAPFCDRCGRPVAGRVDHGYVCAACTAQPPAYVRARSALVYMGSAQALVAALKYRHAVWLAPLMAAFLAAALEAQFPGVRFDRVAPVPLHPARRRARGFNQSALLARGLARRTGLRDDPALLRRIRETPSQTHLTASQRLTNVKGAFSLRASHDPEGEDLLLIDDVMTTGATINECARVLLRHGAASVSALTFARGA